MDSNQVNLTFDNLSYSVRTSIFSKKRKQLLSNVCGDFRPGELTAIVGPSGAGKSTLMNILAGFTTSNITGSIQINRSERKLQVFRHSSAYIMQNDNLQPYLTVQETMSMAADIKLETTTSRLVKKEIVDRVLKNLSLDAVRDTRAKDLSGGQRKRLAIATELINNPPIMFFDEPLSGLDSVTSRQCFELLKSLAAEGRTIVCTVHQPSATLFEMIDHLYALGRGHCVYAGSPRTLVTYLSILGFQCPTYHNPADYLLEVVSGEYGDHIADLVKSSKNGKTVEQQNVREKTEEHLNCVKPIVHQKSHGDLSSWRQIAVLTKYNMIKLLRNRVLTYLRLSMSILISLQAGLLFYGIGQDAAYALDNFNMLFFTVLFLMFISMNTTLIAFPLELPVLRREYFNRWYKLHSFYLANRLADLPLQLIAGSIYVLVIYCLSGQLMELDRLSMFLLTCLLVSLVAQMIGLIIGATFDVQTAAILGPFAVVPTLIFSGFFVHLNDASPYLQWLFHLSFCKYGFEGVMYATYGLDRPRMKCSANYCHFASPNVILKEFGAIHLNYWFAMAILAALYIVLNFIAYFALRFKLKTQNSG